MPETWRPWEEPERESKSLAKKKKTKTTPKRAQEKKKKARESERWRLNKPIWIISWDPAPLRSTGWVLGPQDVTGREPKKRKSVYFGLGEEVQARPDRVVSVEPAAQEEVQWWCCMWRKGEIIKASSSMVKVNNGVAKGKTVPGKVWSIYGNPSRSLEY